MILLSTNNDATVHFIFPAVEPTRAPNVATELLPFDPLPAPLPTPTNCKPPRPFSGEIELHEDPQASSPSSMISGHRDRHWTISSAPSSSLLPPPIIEQPPRSHYSGNQARHLQPFCQPRDPVNGDRRALSPSSSLIFSKVTTTRHPALSDHDKLPVQDGKEPLLTSLRWPHQGKTPPSEL